MALKNFDFKGLMLKHGQYVALGIGLIVLLPLLVMGLGKIFSSGRASANANVLLDSQKRANGYLQTSRPPEDAAKPPVEFFVDLKVNPIDPAPYDTDSPWYTASTVEDIRRRNPEVLLVSDLGGELIRGGIESYMVVQAARICKRSFSRTRILPGVTPTQKKQAAALAKYYKRQGLGDPGNSKGLAPMGLVPGSRAGGMGAGAGRVSPVVWGYGDGHGRLRHGWPRRHGRQWTPVAGRWWLAGGGLAGACSAAPGRACPARSVEWNPSTWTRSAIRLRKTSIRNA